MNEEGNNSGATGEDSGNSDGMNTSSGDTRPSDTITGEKEGTEKYYNRIARKMAGRTTRQVLGKLQQLDKASSIGKDLGKDPKTVKYHIEKLESENLIKPIGETDNGATAYKTTVLGELILDRVNIPR